MPKRIVTRVTEHRGAEAAARHGGLKTGLAMAIVVLGVAAFLEPTRTAVPSVRLAGTIMVAAGLFQLPLALSANRHHPLAWGLGTGIAYTGVGSLFVLAPQLGVATLSWFLALAQIIVGTERGLTALRDRGAHWPWFVALGALLVVSGTSIALGWPGTGLVAIGRFVGINLVAEGVVWLTILRRSRKPPGASVTFAPPEKLVDSVKKSRP